jgi:hypothetical protein
MYSDHKPMPLLEKLSHDTSSVLVASLANDLFQKMNKRFLAGSAAVARRMLAMAAANAALLPPPPRDEWPDWAADLVLYVMHSSHSFIMK